MTVNRDNIDRVGRGVTRASRSTGTTAAQTAAASGGLLSTLIGAAGFIPGITKHLGDIKFAGHDSGAMLFDRYQTSWLMNLVAIGIGLAGLAAARGWSSSRGWLLGAGALMLALWIYGLVTKNSTGANFLPTNNARDWLHFALGLGSMALGAVMGRAPADARTTARPAMR